MTAIDIPLALHRGESDLPFVDLGDGSDLQLLQCDVEAGLWVIRTRFQPGYDREDFKRRLEAEGEIVGLETTWTRADGSPAYVRENARLVRDANGRPECYEGTVEDLTERRRAEEEVWRAKEQLRTLQDLSLIHISEPTRPY